MAEFELFDNLEDYQIALGDAEVFTEDFEGFEVGENLDDVDFLPGVFVTSNFEQLEVFGSLSDKVLFGFDGNTRSQGDAFYQIDFSEPYNAVGFDINSFDPETPGPAVLEIVFNDDPEIPSSTSIDIFPTNETESEPIFFGVIADTPIQSIVLTEGPEIGGSGNEEIALDNFAIANIPSSSERQEITSSFSIDEPNSVPFELFNVLVPGTIEVEVSWTNGIIVDGIIVDEFDFSEFSEDITVSLEGRRRPELPDPTTPYAQVTGSSPLTLTYEVTEEDIARGVNWRLVIDGADEAGITEGNIKITTPFDSEADAIFQQEKISLRSGDFLPSPTLQDDFLDELDETSAEGLHGVITLNTIPGPDEQIELQEAGIIRQSFFANQHAYGFVDQDVDLSDPDIAELVQSFTPLEPEDKIDPNLLVGNYQSFFIPEIDENYVLNDDGSLTLYVLFAQDVSLETIRSILEQEAISFSPSSDSLWEVNLTQEELVNLAANDEVEWIAPGPFPPLLDNSNTRPFVNVDDVQDAQVIMGNINYNGLTGNGITVAVQDNGIDGSHPDLSVVADLNPGSGSHGTHVAGIIAGNGQNSDGQTVNRTDVFGRTVYGTLTGIPFQWRGIAPNASLIDALGQRTVGQRDPMSLSNAAPLLDAIQNNSLDISNQSQTISVDGDYDGTNVNIDQFISGRGTSNEENIPRRPKVVSAGNNGEIGRNTSTQSGYFSISKQVKNAVVVGNWDASDQLPNGDGNIDNDALHFTSSLGPAHDGRIKPDLVAPGSSVISTDAGNNSYVSKTGTSMASPVVAGIHALLLEGWGETYEKDIDQDPPLPSTLRALLIQTAVDIVNNDVRSDDPTTTSQDERQLQDIDSDNNPDNGNDGLGRVTATVGPDYATGWGLVDAEAAVNLMQDSRDENGVPIPDRIIEDAAKQSDINEYKFVVTQSFVDSGDPLKLTLAWDDAEGAVQIVAINPQLVNDLDLELVAPDGTIFYPWQLGHTITDKDGNPLPDNAQPPGTEIKINREITPTDKPKEESDYIPADALTGNGAWVATRGKDHLNNVEQVLVDNVDLQTGEWTARVIGFNVQNGNVQDGMAQDYSLVGFPSSEITPCDTIGLPGDIIGTPGNDNLEGTREDDRMFGLAGDDDIIGERGNDFLCGAAGHDLLNGGKDDDTLYGESGNDTLKGEKGQDFLDGGEGNDLLEGGKDEDSLNQDTLNGGAGDDTLRGEKADDLLEGGEGNDLLEGGKDEDTLNGGDGNDTLKGEKGDDLLDGGTGNDLLDGGDREDTITGGTGNDTLKGGDNDDVLRGVDPTAFQPGIGEIDILTGDDPGDEDDDLFVLGDASWAYYEGDSEFDYALITDFDEKDMIQLNGRAENYELRPTPAGLPNGTAIFLTLGSFDDLIAIVQGTSELDLSDDKVFSFV